VDQMRLAVNIETFSYPDGTVALSEIRLGVAKGEFCGILGSNGSGKTTLLKIMDGLVKDFSGSVALDGTDIRKLHPRDIYRKMGLVFQNPDDQLFAHSVFEDVAFGPRNMGMPEPEVDRRVADALAAVEMVELARKNIHNLSYGQKKRACIAGLLAMGHGILLLDEPTAGLDPMGEYRMMELLTRLNKDNGPQRRPGAAVSPSASHPQQGTAHPRRHSGRGVHRAGGNGERQAAAAPHCRTDLPPQK